MKRKIFFERRIKEPKEMEITELETFEDVSIRSYHQWMIPLVDDALEKACLTEGKILDIGCGPGLLLKEFASRSRNLMAYGIDISPSAVKMAINNCKSLKGVYFSLANVYRLPFNDDTFDLVVCKDSLHHFNTLNLALLEMLRVVKENGLVYLQDIRRDLPQYLLQRTIPTDTLFKKLQFYSARAAYTKEEIRDTLGMLPIEHFTVKTRKLTKKVHNHYNGQMDARKLRESFQSRYIAVIKKQRGH